MGKGKLKKRATAEISTTNTSAATKSEHRSKKRRRTKSKIAAYIEGKIQLSGIMHPSRITVIDKKPHFNCDMINEYTTSRKLRREFKYRKQPPLKDYISGKVPVSVMLPPGKMNEIPQKTKQLQDYQKRNFFTPEMKPKIRRNYHHNDTSALAKNIKKSVSKKYDKVNEDKSKKTPNTDLLPSFGMSTKTSCSVEENTEVGGGDEIEIIDVKRYLASRRFDIDTLDSVLNKMRIENPACEYNSTQRNSSLARSSKNSYSSKGKGCITVSDITPRTSSQHSIESDCTEIQTPSELSSYTRCARVLEQNRIIKAHEEVEKHLLSQIVHLRRSRDKYKRYFRDIKNLVRILLQRSFSFRMLNID